MCDIVHKGPGIKVDHEAVLMKEIGTNDGLLDVCHDEDPLEAPPQTQTDSDTSGTVGGNTAAIDGPKGVLWLGWMSAI